MRKILKGDGLSSCDFVAINAQAEPAEFKNQPKQKKSLASQSKKAKPANKYKKENYELFTLQLSGHK